MTGADDDTTASAPPPPRAADAGTVVGAASAVALLVTVAVMGRDLWFFSDDWNIYADYHSGHLLEPFNGHLSAVPVGLYQLLFHTVGVGSYWPYRLCGLAALAVLGFQVLRHTRARVGGTTGGWVAALAVTAVLWNSAGNTDVMFPFLMNFSLPIAALIAVWWHLDRRTTRNDAAAAVWLAVALATSGLGVMVLVAVVVELAVARAPWRRWAVLSPGVVLWVGWYLLNRDASEASTDVGAVLSYSARMFLGGTTSLAAGWKPGGVVLAAAFVGVVALAATRWRSLDARALGALAAPAAFIGLTALTRLTIVPRIPPDELRYRWAVAAYLVMAVVAMWPGRRHPSGPTVSAARTTPARTTPARTTPAWAPAAAGGAAAVVLVLGAVQLLRGISNWTDMVVTAAPGLRANLFAAEAVGPRRIDPDHVLPLSYVPVHAGDYLDAVAAVGSPIAGEDPSTFGGRPDQRLTADELLVDELPVTVSEAPPGVDGRCRNGLVLAVPDGSGVRLRASEATTVGVRRFSGPEGETLVRVPGPGWWQLDAPADAPGVDGDDLPYRVSSAASFCS